MERKAPDLLVRPFICWLSFDPPKGKVGSSNLPWDTIYCLNPLLLVVPASILVLFSCSCCLMFLGADAVMVGSSVCRMLLLVSARFQAFCLYDGMTAVFPAFR
jgi:hypothetical protein